MLKYEREQCLERKGFFIFNSQQQDYNKAELEQLVSLPHSDFKVKRIVIESLSEFIKFIEAKIPNYSMNNPVYYRGQPNWKYCPLPTAFRSDELYRERDYFNEFGRRFAYELNGTKYTIEQLVLMQHYEMNSRVLDLTEDPLIALFFACYCGDYVEDKKEWGEVSMVRYGVKPQNVNGIPKLYVDDDIKYYQSNTTSILANCATMPETFSYEAINIAYKNDNHFAAKDGYINFIDLVCRSVVLRTPRTFERVSVQSGAFVLCNCNEVNFAKKVEGFTASEFTSRIIELSEQGIDFNYNQLVNGETEFGNKFKDFEMSDFIFTKVKPYNLNNKVEKFRYDPFDYRKLVYTTDDNIQYVLLIPPKAKEIILEQLNKFLYRKETVYPEFLNVTRFFKSELANGK